MGTKYVFVTGGVVSSLGKGITAACLARLLINTGLSVTIQKFDPYLNVDPGTMSPYQHGEVFVTDSGAETDLDLGHYERFTDGEFSNMNNVTQGQVYLSLLNMQFEANVKKTLQVVPDVTNKIKQGMHDLVAHKKPDVMIVEIGGTIGDIESVPFLEALRQMQVDVGINNCAFLHVVLVPELATGELKTKPAQHSVNKLRQLGINPDFLIARTEVSLSDEIREKLALFCTVKKDHVIENANASSIYEVPLLLHKENLDGLVCERLGLKTKEPDMKEWTQLVYNLKNPEKEVHITVVGKYTEQQDAYISITESFIHAGIYHKAKVRLKWITAEELTDENASELIGETSGILVPGGFGNRGIEGKISAVRYARENKIPFFGICLGMQMAVIEYARNVLGMEGAHTSEVDPDSQYKVIDLMPDQRGINQLGGTLRLGTCACRLYEGTNAAKAYKTLDISERHRHRYEFNNEYLDDFVKGGMTIGGINPERNLVEIVELKDHPWFTGVQFHPEFKSRPNRAHPLFRDFVGAAIEYEKKHNT